MRGNDTKRLFKHLDKYIQTLYIIAKEHFMAVSTVNISFQDDLLSQIDLIAQNEARTRSELIREAARIYIERKKKWESIFSYGKSLATKYKFTENDVNEEIKKYRKEKSKK
jgi:metal-responsive CopG/Arc/MetJ family transcriptional regulator